MNNIKRSFPLERYPRINKVEDFITIEIPDIVKNYKQEEKTDRKIECKKTVSHKDKTYSEMTYTELMWKIHKYQEEK